MDAKHITLSRDIEINRHYTDRQHDAYDRLAQARARYQALQDLPYTDKATDWAAYDSAKAQNDVEFRAAEAELEAAFAAASNDPFETTETR